MKDIEKYVYKYENKINHKIYIGQTNDLNRRYREHLRGQSSSISLIDRAIKRYGIENFQFEVLEKTSNYDERERFWIEYYRSYKPYGYNICKGGGYLPDMQKENHPQAIITEQIARSIQKDLANFKMTKPAIVKRYKVTYSIVENINSGHTWNYYGLEYPIRPSEGELNNQRALEVIDLLQNSNLSYKEIGKKVGWGASQVYMINRGTNHPQKDVSYPIREDPKDYSDKIDSCIALLLEGKSNSEIGTILGTSSAWVGRINNGKSHRKKDLNYPIRK